LLQGESARFETNIHEASAREVGVGEYLEHPSSLPLEFSLEAFVLQSLLERPLHGASSRDHAIPARVKRLEQPLIRLKAR
jgi:hypothetical protein